MVWRRRGVKRPELRSEATEGARGKEHGEFLARRDGGMGVKRRRKDTERREEEAAAGLGAGGQEARATDQEPGSRGMEQVQAASEAFGPEGAARA